jgi:hypothetical protein
MGIARRATSWCQDRGLSSMGNIGVQRRLWHGARVRRTRVLRLEGNRKSKRQRSQWVLAGDKAQGVRWSQQEVCRRHVLYPWLRC